MGEEAVLPVIHHIDQSVNLYESHLNIRRQDTHVHYVQTVNCVTQGRRKLGYTLFKRQSEKFCCIKSCIETQCVTIHNCINVSNTTQVFIGDNL